MGRAAERSRSRLAAWAGERLWQLHHSGDPRRLLQQCHAGANAFATSDAASYGVCNVSPALIQTLLDAKSPLVSVQNEFSPWVRAAAKPAPAKAGGAGSRTGVLDLCAKHNLVFFAYSPFGGLKTRRGERDLERDFPQFAEEAIRRGGGVTAHAVLLRVMRTLWPHCVPLVGTRSPLRAARLLDYERLSMTRLEALALWPSK